MMRAFQSPSPDPTILAVDAPGDGCAKDDTKERKFIQVMNLETLQLAQHVCAVLIRCQTHHLRNRFLSSSRSCTWPRRYVTSL